jgi:dCTP deaminase
MILPDHEIERLCKEQAMVAPYNPALLNPASIDVLLGDHLMVEVEHTPELQRFDISSCTADDPYWLAPNEFLLAETKEIFNLPDHVSAQFILKSSRAREGIEHLLAGYCDPGWHGSRLTLELHNSRRFHNIALYPSMKIGQMVFHSIAGTPAKTYAVTGRYNNHLSVHDSLG